MTVPPSADFGFCGRIGIVDVGSRRTDIVPLDRSLAERYLGATGINTRLLADFAGPAGTAWDADNPVIVGVGPLVGTLVPGASRTSITTRSPITGGYGHSNSGSFGDALKRAWFDHLVIVGIADEPVVVVCDEGTLSVEPAADAWGRDVYEATDLLADRYPGASIAAIGPAGEHQAISATILTDRHGAFGSSGLGCALGIKRVKAIVARGTGTTQVMDRPALTRTSLRLFRALMDQPHIEGWRRWGTLIQFSDENPSGMDEARDRFGFDMSAWLEVYRSRLWEGPATCPGCPVGCKARIRNGDHTIRISCPTGTMTLPFAMHTGASAVDHAGVVQNAETANRLGISTLWVGQLRAWVRDLAERGIVTEADTGDWSPTDDSPAAMDRFMESIAHRRGFGDVLAGPIGEARRRIGGGAEDDPVRKGMLAGVAERHGDPSLGRWTGYSFSRVIDPRGPIAETAYSSIAWVPGRTEEQIRRYCHRIGVPPEREGACVTGGVDGYDLGRLTRYIEGYNMVLYAIGQCQRPYFSRIMDLDRVAEAYTATTGIAVTPASLAEAGERIVTLQRLFNAAHGLDRDADVGPEHEMDRGAAGALEQMLDAYYDEHGWSERGIPMSETLQRLDLTSPTDRALEAAASSPGPA